MTPSLLVAAAAPNSDPFTFNQLGIAAVVCVVLSTWLWWVLKRLSQRDLEVAQLNGVIQQLLRERGDREQELGSTTVPLLERVTQLLYSTPAAVARATQTVQPTANPEVDQVLDALKQMLSRVPGSPPGPH